MMAMFDLRAWLVILLLVASQTIQAAESRSVCPPPVSPPSPEVARQAMDNARDHGFLWRISKDGRASYLYGTIHIARFEWMFPGPGVMQALKEADTVALELDLMDADIRSRMMEGMASPSATSLPAALVKRMRSQAAATCVPYESIAHLSPEMQITMLTVMAGRLDGLEAAYAVDAVLAGIGHGANKNVVSLETPEAQAQMLLMKDERDTIAFVQESLDELEAGRASALLKRIARVWADSDYAELERYGEWCDCLETEMERGMMRRLLDERNPHMAERIDALHREGKRVFAAVGSLHMFGQFAIPALMAKRGYRVERIVFKRQ
ncbi:MAG: TraB/GumN family protein [Nitrosomonadales bacterium]|nr:TraB/GumN family protein [Nitrosomonadales bacterium]